MVQFSCPTCRTALQSSDHQAGSRIVCPKCHTAMQVPGAQPAAIVTKPGPPSSPEWHYTKNGQQAGPVSWMQLQHLVASGHVNATDLVWKAGMPSWVAASTVLDSSLAVPPPLPMQQKSPARGRNMAFLGAMVGVFIGILIGMGAGTNAVLVLGLVFGTLGALAGVSANLLLPVSSKSDEGALGRAFNRPVPVGGFMVVGVLLLVIGVFDLFYTWRRAGVFGLPGMFLTGLGVVCMIGQSILNRLK